MMCVSTVQCVVEPEKSGCSPQCGLSTIADVRDVSEGVLDIRCEIADSDVEILFKIQRGSANNSNPPPDLLSAINSSSKARGDQTQVKHLALVALDAAPLLLPQLAGVADRLQVLCFAGDGPRDTDSFRPTVWHRGWQRRLPAGQDLHSVLSDVRPTQDAKQFTVGAIMERIASSPKSSAVGAEFRDLADAPLQAVIISYRDTNAQADRVFAQVLEKVGRTAMLEVDKLSEGEDRKSHRPQTRTERHGQMAVNIMRMSTFCQDNGLTETAEDLMALGLRHLILRES